MRDPLRARTSGVPIEPAKDSRAFLCEACGYPLRGLARRGFCPECGRPIADSHPGRRSGTPWQSGASLGSWWRTVVLAARSPRGVLRTARVELGPSRRLAWASCAVAAGIGVGGLGLPVSVAIARVLEPDRPPGAVELTAAGLIGWLLVWASLFGLTWTEARGIRFFGTRHGYRITPAVAWTVCAHGCTGWVMGSVLGVLGAWTSLGLWSLGAPGWGTFWLPLVGVGAGFLYFEWFAWLGMRVCRFANAPGSDGAAREDAPEEAPHLQMPEGPAPAGGRSPAGGSADQSADGTADETTGVTTDGAAQEPR